MFRIQRAAAFCVRLNRWKNRLWRARELVEDVLLYCAAVALAFGVLSVLEEAYM